MEVKMMEGKGRWEGKGRKEKAVNDEGRHKAGADIYFLYRN